TSAARKRPVLAFRAEPSGRRAPNRRATPRRPAPSAEAGCGPHSPLLAGAPSCSFLPGALAPSLALQLVERQRVLFGQGNQRSREAPHHHLWCVGPRSLELPPARDDRMSGGAAIKRAQQLVLIPVSRQAQRQGQCQRRRSAPALEVAE